MDYLIELLRKGTSLKTLTHSTSEAETILTEAYKYASLHEMPKPWPQLAAYRLAHVLLRDAKHNSDYERIDFLLQEAASANCLGPLPRLFRLAVLHRLLPQISDLKRTAKPVIKQLISDIEHYNGALRSQENYSGLTAVQGAFFNMLELAVYFTGFPYQMLEGKGRDHDGILGDKLRDQQPFSDLFSSMEDWRLVGSEKNLTAAAYPGELVLEELQDRMKNMIKKPCMCFKLSEDRVLSEWNFNLQKNKAGEYVWEKVKSNSSDLLFCSLVLGRHFYERYHYISVLTGRDDNRAVDNARQIKSRLQKRMKSKLQIDFPLFLENSDTGIPQFNPDVTILGAVEVHVLNIRSDRDVYY